MYAVKITSKFKKDIKLVKKRCLDLALLDKAITQLLKNGVLPKEYKPHTLKGDYQGFWECHIQPDWLLIWEQNDVIKLVSLTRTGTHSDLF